MQKKTQKKFNIIVLTGLILQTGLPILFVTAGSTSFVVFMSVIGEVLNVDRQS